MPYVDLPLQHIATGSAARHGPGPRPGRRPGRWCGASGRGSPAWPCAPPSSSGFPGETEEHFEELLRYVEEEPFEHLVVFPFEREPGTAAWDMAPRVPLTVRRARRARLLELQQRLARVRNARRVGERVTVMIDGPAGRKQYAARTAGSAFEVDGGVVVEGEGLVPGTLVEVRVTGAAAYDLFARAEAAGPYSSTRERNGVMRAGLAVALLGLAVLASSAEAKTFKYAAGPKPATDTTFTISDVEIRPIVRSRGPKRAGDQLPGPDPGRQHRLRQRPARRPAATAARTSCWPRPRATRSTCWSSTRCCASCRSAA